MLVERLGPYKIVDRIGAGGMGEVYKGVHEETGQVVAIKLLESGEDDDPQLAKRFRREIVSAGRLSHDNIVRLFDSGEQDEHIWYAMEYIDGSSLSELIASGEPLPVPKALSIARDVCKAFI
ncbi:MAG: protein kinase [Candidatus Riflebacteria bacterium]|nr:protein kinase [Candidatus Riflebacteria bacterium]